eukprot:7921990-Pyramimonas_sp.AAC.1
MRAAAQGPSAELLWGHETCEGCTELGVGGACGRQPSAELPMGPRNVRGMCRNQRAGRMRAAHWGLRRSSYGATKRVRGAPTLAWMTHAGGSTGAFGGAPMGPRN